MNPRVKPLMVLGSAVVIIALLAQTAISQNDDQDVLKVIPENYTLLFENAVVRVSKRACRPAPTSHTIRVELKY